jgi:hypothetical protein
MTSAPDNDMAKVRKKLKKEMLWLMVQCTTGAGISG